MGNKIVIRSTSCYLYINKAKSKKFIDGLVYFIYPAYTCGGKFECRIDEFGSEIAKLIQDNDYEKIRFTPDEKTLDYEYRIRIEITTKNNGESILQSIRFDISDNSGSSITNFYIVCKDPNANDNLDDRIKFAIEYFLTNFYILGTRAGHYPRMKMHSISNHIAEFESNYIIRYCGESKISFQIEHFNYPKPQFTRIRQCMSENFTEVALNCILGFSRQKVLPENKTTRYLHQRNNVKAPMRSISMTYHNMQFEDSIFYDISSKYIIHGCQIETGIYYNDGEDIRKMSRFLLDGILHSDVY